MIRIIHGDILQANDDEIIMHQCNCLTQNSLGLARILFEKYPYANVYNQKRKLGDVIVSGTGTQRRIANVMAQYTPGCPKQCNLSFDSSLHRAQRLAQAFKVLSEQGYRRVAIPRLINCGLAGGSWNETLPILLEAAHKYLDCLSIYSLDGNGMDDLDDVSK